MTELEALNLSTQANDGQGDPLRVGGVKINSNQQKLFTLARVIQENTLQVYKAIGNSNIDALESGDMITGWFSSTLFLKHARYNGGNTGDLTSYTVIDDIDFT